MSQTSSKKILFLVYASLFFSAIFGGAGFVFMKNALAVFPTTWFVFWRFFLSVVFLAPFLAKSSWRAPRHTLIDGVIVGVLFFAATLVQLQGIARTDAGRSAFINSTAVVLVPILQAFILRRVPSWTVVSGCLLCLFGVGFLALQNISGQADGRAEMLVFAGTCIFALQTIFFKRAARTSDPHVLSFIEFLTISLLALPLALTYPCPWTAGARAWNGVFYAAIMMNIAMVMVANNALRYITPTSMVVLGSMQSVYGALFGVLLLGESVTWQLMLSGCAILGGILVSISSAYSSSLRST